MPAGGEKCVPICKEMARGLGLKVELADQIKEEVAGEDQDFALKLDTDWGEACQSRMSV